MTLNEAIIKCVNEICQEKNISVCNATLNGGKSPSALYDLLKGRTKSSTVQTVQRFCKGAGITLKDFFDAECFTSINIYEE